MELTVCKLTLEEQFLSYLSDGLNRANTNRPTGGIVCQQTKLNYLLNIYCRVTGRNVFFSRSEIVTHMRDSLLNIDLVPVVDRL